MNLFKYFYYQLRSFLMTSKQDVLSAVTAAALRISTQLAENTQVLANKITVLQAELANGTPITSADLDEIVAAVNGLAAPVPVAVLPTTAP